MQVGQRYVADALAVEEACASAVLSVAVNCDGSVSRCVRWHATCVLTAVFLLVLYHCCRDDA